ncbi:MAG: HEAT repeat domain-containing protein [Granulosicoccus sp.]
MLNPRAIAAVICLLVAVGIGWLWYQPEPASLVSSENLPKQISASPSEDSDSPFSVKNESTDAPANAPLGEAADDNAHNANPSATEDSLIELDASNRADGGGASATQLPALDIASLGRSALSDSAFLELADRLRAEPQLLLQLIDEFRQETDLERLAQLSRLLGEVGGTEVTLAASELIFSGDPQSRDIGLELLQQVQPGNDDARDIVSGLLTTEVEPEVLVSTLTTLSSPGKIDDAVRANLSEQVAYLTQHDDASVRAISINILSRWTTDSRYTSVLIDGLDDSTDFVRKSAAYALVDHEDPSPEVMDSLFIVLNNEQEQEPVRRAAILALRGMELSDAQRSHVRAIERKLDTRPR